MVRDEDLLWIRVRATLRNFESLDDRNSRTLGWLECLSMR